MLHTRTYRGGERFGLPAELGGRTVNATLVRPRLLPDGVRGSERITQAWGQTIDLGVNTLRVNGGWQRYAHPRWHYGSGSTCTSSPAARGGSFGGRSSRASVVARVKTSALPRQGIGSAPAGVRRQGR